MPNTALDWPNSNLLAAVFDQLSDAVIVYDSKLQITAVNHATERLFGLSADDMIGRDCREVFKCGHCEPGCGVLVGINQMPSVNRSTVKLHTDNGRERLAVISTTQFYDANGGVEGMVATIRDVTDEITPQKREVVAESKLMRDLMSFTRRVAASEAGTILLDGENGTGKDLIAKTLHYESLRRAEPFIAINCAAIPETLLESELFGYEKGAFTDAKAQNAGFSNWPIRGRCSWTKSANSADAAGQAAASAGRADVPAAGRAARHSTDLRVIAATNRNLREAVKEGLSGRIFFRLNVIQIVIPPLRERPEDILPLAQILHPALQPQIQAAIEGYQSGGGTLLLEHDWPGNVRELRNAIERAMILEETRMISPASLPMSHDIGGAANERRQRRRCRQDPKLTACHLRTTSGPCWSRRSRSRRGTRRRRRSCCISPGIRCGTR